MSSKTESHYFNSYPPPKALPRHESLARSFVQLQLEKNRRVVLVTSGGTTVPVCLLPVLCPVFRSFLFKRRVTSWIQLTAHKQLENQTVRFIDNFSAGTRGAASAEQFLENGYAVIFLHRQFSLLPYSRHYSHSTNCFLDFMDEDPVTSSIVVRDEYQSSMRDVLRKYRHAKNDHLLLLLPFTTVTEYMFELRALAHIMKPLGANALFYLAAAVSDFFIPRDRMAEHKIQSSEIPDYIASSSGSGSGSAFAAHTEIINNPDEYQAIRDDDTYTGYNQELPLPQSSADAKLEEQIKPRRLVIDLDPVPKFLHRLVDGWAPVGSMIVSFKLETDPTLLVYKAHTSLQRYSHHLVIGNLLSTRKWEVVFVSPEEPHERWIRVPKARRSKSISGSVTQIGLAEKSVHSSGEHVTTNDNNDQPPEGDPANDKEEKHDTGSGLEIESLIIPELVKLHSKKINAVELEATK